MIAHPIEPNLKAIFQSIEQTGVHHLGNRVFARGAAGFVRLGHAARIVDQNRDDVLLGTQGGNAESGVPQHEQQQASEQRLQNPNDGFTRTRHSGRARRLLPYQVPQHHGCGQHP